MKLNAIHLILFLTPIILASQTKPDIMEGKVTFKSTSNVYVRFISTEDINTGDSLFLYTSGSFEPVLVVKQKSSSSCVCSQLGDSTIDIGQTIAFFPKNNSKNEKKPNIINKDKSLDQVSISDSLENDTLKDKTKKQLLNGRLTFSTNASLNPDQKNNFQRIRTAFSMNIQNIKNSDFSAQTYLTYRHRYGIDQNVSGFYDDFKVFTFALQYDPGKKYSFSIGRKINNNIANMGAIDGVQAEYRLGKYEMGTFAGTRPDMTNYSFNSSLAQFGAYIVRNDQTSSGTAQTSIAFAEQQNHFKTDRRFLYIQHNNALAKNIFLFLSSELDLFKKINGIISNQPTLTSVYFSLRYRLRKNLSFSSSYDNRRNIIFYESNLTYIDQLLAQETRQGFRIQTNYNPLNSISINASAFYRYQGGNTQPTKNYVGNISFNNIPGTKMVLALNANLMESYYFKGTIIGGQISDNFLKGKVNIEMNYRNVEYNFYNSESSLKQHIGGINININLLKLTSLLLSYEGTFEPTTTYHRYFITAVQRFKN